MSTLVERKKNSNKSEPAPDPDKLKEAWKWMRWVILPIAVVLTISVIAALIRGNTHSSSVAKRSIATSNVVMPDSPPMASCPTFSTTEDQSCIPTPGITWASTGTTKGLLPCIHPLPPYGNYTLWQSDGVAKPIIWTPATALPIVNVYGFQGSDGKPVRYKLVSSADQCT